MLRTTVYIEEIDKRALASKARRSGRGEAELIREGIRRVLQEDREGGLPDWVGMFSSDGGSIARELPKLREQYRRDLARRHQSR